MTYIYIKKRRLFHIVLQQSKMSVDTNILFLIAYYNTQNNCVLKHEFLGAFYVLLR